MPSSSLLLSLLGLLKFMVIESVVLSNHFILCHPFPLLPSVFSSTRVFSNESALCTRWPNYWSYGFSIIPSNEYSGLISFRIDGFDLLAVQETLKNLLQHHSLASLVLQHSAFFMVQLSHLYITTGKTIALTMWDIAGKVMSLFFNIVSRFVIAFLPWSIFLIPWVQLLSTIILEPKKIKSVTASTLFHFYLPRCNGTRFRDLSFCNVEFQARIFTLLFDPHQEAL